MLKLKRTGKSTSTIKKAGHVTRLANFSGFGGSGGSSAPTSGGYGGGGGGMGGMGNSGSSPTANQQIYTPVMDYLDEGSVVDIWMSRSPERLHRLNRKIYAEDSVAGPAIELYKDLPWSEFALTGVQDPEILRFYSTALNAINTVSLLPQITQEFLVMGKVIGTMIMDDRKGYFTSVQLQNPDFIRVTPAYVSGFAPKLDLMASPNMLALLQSSDPRDKAVQQQLGPFADLIRKNQDIPLHPANSFYLPRQLAPYDSIGASVYTRIYHLVAYEKALINATLTTAHRRLSRIRHLVAGEDNWDPTEDELNGFAELFMDAEKDPVGALIATRTGVTVNEVGGNTLSDIKTMSDEGDYLSKAKMNALGISETFLTGEASYNSMDHVLSIFLDRVRAHRTFITNRFILDQVLKPLAKKHKFIRQSPARLAHRIRVAESESDDRIEYILPSIAYEKSLRPTGDKDFLDILEVMESKGMSITLRTWAATGGVDMQTELDQLPDDLNQRKIFAKHNSQVEEIAAGSSDDLGGGGDDSGDEEPMDLEDAAAELSASTTQKMAALSAVGSLPHMRNGEFLGITSSFLADRTEALCEYLGGRSKKKMLASDHLRLLSTGNPQRDTSLRYLLSRAGLLHNADVGVEFMGDATKALASLGLHGNVLADEISELYTMATATAKVPQPTVTKLHKREVKEHMMLTGHQAPWRDQD